LLILSGKVTWFVDNSLPWWFRAKPTSDNKLGEGISIAP